MAGKRKYLIAFLLVALLLSGCSKSDTTSDSKSYTVYYTNLAGTKLESKSYTPTSDRFDGILTELLEEFKNPTHSDVVSAMPLGVNINGYTMGVDNLQVDFNGAYLGLSNVQEILLRSSLAKTLLQLPGVAKVRITVDGQPLVDNDGNEVLAMDDNTFIDSQGEGINSYHYVILNLYFANSTGDKVAKEVRNVFYSSNLIMEKVIVEQIIQGPINAKLQAVVDPSVLVKSVKISNNICIVDLDRKFNNVPEGTTVEPETCLYAFVNAICDACEVEGVQFRIEGESNVRFRGEVNLDRVFQRNPDMIEASGVTKAFAEIFLNEAGDETDQMVLVDEKNDTGSSSGLASANKAAEGVQVTDTGAAETDTANNETGKEPAGPTAAETATGETTTGETTTGETTAPSGNGTGNTGGNQSGRGVGVDSALVEDNG